MQGLSEEQVKALYITKKEEYLAKLENIESRPFRHTCGIITYQTEKPSKCLCQNIPSGKNLRVCSAGHGTLQDNKIIQFRFNCQKCQEIQRTELPEEIQLAVNARKTFYNETKGIDFEFPNDDKRKSPEYLYQRNQAELFGRVIAEQLVKVLKSEGLLNDNK